MKIIVIRFSSLGDVVLTLPVFDRLRNLYPQAEIVALTKESFADVYRNHEPISRVMTLSKDQSLLSLLNQIRKEQFDVILDLHSNLRSTVIRLFCGIPRQYHYAKATLARRLFVQWRLKSPELKQHTLDRYMEVVDQLSGNTSLQSPVLVVQTAFLGDAVLTLPMLDALHSARPNIILDVLCTPEIQEIFASHMAVHEVLVYDKRGRDKGLNSLWRWAKVIRQKGYKTALVPHRSFRSALLAWLGNIPRRVGFGLSQGRWLLTQIVPFEWGIHDVERNMKLLDALGIHTPSPTLQLTVNPQAMESILQRYRDDGIQSSDRLLGINPGSIWPTKRWLPERFAELSDRVIRELNMKVVFFGGKKDIPIVESVIQSMREIPLNWAGKTNLQELIAAISRCNLFLTNDSGPMHIAVATHVSTIAIFGPTTRELGFFPYGNDHVVIERDLECRPCGLHGAERCPLGHFKCMKEISVENVFQTIQQKYVRSSSV